MSAAQEGASQIGSIRVTRLPSRDSGSAKTKRSVSGPRFVQQPLALQYPHPGETIPFRPILALVPPESTNATTDVLSPDEEALLFFDRQQTPDEELPDPRQWSARLIHAIMEIRTGRRPLHQLTRWTSHDVFVALADGIAASSKGRSPARTVAGLRVTRPASGVAEVSAVLVAADRSRAIALRLEGWDGRWLCTSLDVI